MAKTTFSGPVVSKNGFVGTLELGAPQTAFVGDKSAFDAAEYAGAMMVDESDDKLYFSNGTDWKEVSLEA